MFILNSPIVSSICIFLNDCPAALNYISKRRNEPETRTILRNAHCGVAYKNGRQEAKVHCDKIPEFEVIPAGCVPLDQCPAAKELIRTRRDDPATIILLRSSACCQNVRSDLILCENVARKATGIVRFQRIVQFDLEEALVKEKTVLLPEDCGVEAPSNKLLGGERAEFENFPWLALLQYKNELNNLAFRCHGTLINNRYVVSAAHCLRYTSAQKRLLGNLHKIILGEFDVTTNPDCLPSAFGGYCTDTPQEFSPESIHIHPDFGSDDALSDIALIRLNKNAFFSDFVKPICLPINGVDMKLYEILHIAGWGKTELRSMSPVKLKGKIEYLPGSDCDIFSLDKTQICAGSRTSRVDTCKGDSGGPLTVYRKYPDGELKSVLVGVVSFGGICGSGAAVYSNVSFFMNWIIDTMYD